MVVIYKYKKTRVVSLHMCLIWYRRTATRDKYNESSGISDSSVVSAL
jgi:hypothetical protein